jgi:hypothetical protein
MFVRPKDSTLKSFLLRRTVPRLVVFGAGAAILALGQVLAVNPSVHYSAVPVEQVVAAAPAWDDTDAAAYPECVPSSAWPTGTPAGFLVVRAVREDAHRKMAFDLAWGLNHNHTEVDDVWVVGVCA